MITISSVTLALDSPLHDPNGTLVYVLTIIELIVTVIFAFEAFIKIVATGFVNYMRDTFNFLDFCILVPSLVFYIPFLHVNREVAMLLRAVRIFRPARFFNKSENL